MADIRINALATTAASTASDDFIAIDGSANGTRKLNAYSPTFGGNLTVSGTGTSSVAGKLTIGAVPTLIGVMSVRPVANGILNIRNAGEISANSGAAIDMLNDASDALTDFTVRAANYNFLNTGPVKVGGNLTVSGTGTSSFAGPVTSTVTSGSSPILTASNTSSGGYSIIRAQNDVGGASGNFDLGIGGSAVGGSYQNWGYLYTGGGLSGIRFATTATIQMTLNNSGNLLIGTTTDRSNRVHIAAAGPSYIGMGQLTSTYAGIVFGDVTLADSASGFNIAGNAANSNLVFNVNTGGSMNWRVGNANAFTLSSGSNLLIGTTTDGGQKLQVSGTAAISGALSIGNTVQAAASVASTHKVTISIGGTTYYLLATNV